MQPFLWQDQFSIAKETVSGRLGYLLQDNSEYLVFKYNIFL